MKNLKLFWVVVLAVSGVAISLYFAPITENNRRVFYLSERQLQELQSRADVRNDADAAFRIYRYYEIYKKDWEMSVFWLRKAADLGNESAKEILSRLRPYLDDEPSMEEKKE